MEGRSRNMVENGNELRTGDSRMRQNNTPSDWHSTIRLLPEFIGLLYGRMPNICGTWREVILRCIFTITDTITKAVTLIFLFKNKSMPESPAMRIRAYSNERHAKNIIQDTKRGGAFFVSPPLIMNKYY